MEYQKFSKKTLGNKSINNTTTDNADQADDENRAEHIKALSEFSQDDSPRTESDLPRLSPRQRQVLLWAARGKSSWETGRILGLTEATVKSYVGHACKKLHAQNRTHAVAICISVGVFSLDHEPRR